MVDPRTTILQSIKGGMNEEEELLFAIENDLGRESSTVELNKWLSDLRDTGKIEGDPPVLTSAGIDLIASPGGVAFEFPEEDKVKSWLGNIQTMVWNRLIGTKIEPWMIERGKTKLIMDYENAVVQAIEELGAQNDVRVVGHSWWLDETRDPPMWMHRVHCHFTGKWRIT